MKHYTPDEVIEYVRNFIKKQKIDASDDLMQDLYLAGLEMSSPTSQQLWQVCKTVVEEYSSTEKNISCHEISFDDLKRQIIIDNAVIEHLIEAMLLREYIYAAQVKRLSDIEAEVLCKRFDGYSPKELANEYGVTVTRIRRITNDSLKKLSESKKLKQMLDYLIYY